MKKTSIIASVAVILLASTVPVAADAGIVGTGPAPVPVILPSVTTPVYFHIGALNLTVPWQNVNAVYLYELNEKKSKVGGEAVVASLWKVQATVGAVTDFDGKGDPFIGGNLFFPNPVPSLAILNEIKPGVFGGWSWASGKAIYGVKAAVSIF